MSQWDVALKKLNSVILQKHLADQQVKADGFQWDEEPVDEKSNRKLSILDDI
jgi:hypothetical protein